VRDAGGRYHRVSAGTGAREVPLKIGQPVRRRPARQCVDGNDAVQKFSGREYGKFIRLIGHRGRAC